MILRMSRYGLLIVFYSIRDEYLKYEIIRNKQVWACNLEI